MVPGDPGSRMAAGVQNGDDDNSVCNHSEDDAIREAVDESLTELSVQTGKGRGGYGQFALDRFLPNTQRMRSASRATGWHRRCQSFCLRQVRLGDREQLEGEGHFSRRRCLTSGQGVAFMALSRRPPSGVRSPATPPQLAGFQPRGRTRCPTVPAPAECAPGC